MILLEQDVQQTRPRSGRVLRIRVILEHSDPPIWRRLDVPGEATLGWLHAVLQLAMGWSNSHLHQFLHGTRIISDPDFEMQECEGDPPVEDERKVQIAALLAKPGQSLRYEYDFGDSWNHSVELETYLDASPGAPRAICVAGEGACPPEDCGGIPGYEQLLSALANPKHPEHRAMKRWLGKPFDPERFSIAETNGWLGKLKWPNVTVAALGRILLARQKM